MKEAEIKMTFTTEEEITKVDITGTGEGNDTDTLEMYLAIGTCAHFHGKPEDFKSWCQILPEIYKMTEKAVREICEKPCS